MNLLHVKCSYSTAGNHPRESCDNIIAYRKFVIKSLNKKIINLYSFANLVYPKIEQLNSCFNAARKYRLRNLWNIQRLPVRYAIHSRRRANHWQRRNDSLSCYHSKREPWFYFFLGFSI